LSGVLKEGGMNSAEQSNLIFDWAAQGPRQVRWPDRVMLDDETLRDGLQSPSVSDPSLETKVAILHLMESLGIETADVGLPGAGPHQRDAVTTLCREIDRERMRIRPNCAARTMMVDIQPIAEIAQTTGVPIEACLFIGSSPIRQYAEEWSLEDILRHTREAIRFAVREGLEVMYVTEDTVRSSPEHLRTLFMAAIEAGAKRLCLCDTCGAAVPEGVWNLVYWVKSLLKELGVDVGIDWHGHRDRGLDMGNTLAAIEAGASRVHGTALGVGERVGNTAIEQLLVNLKLLGIRNDDLSRLPEYVELVSQATGVPVPVNTPIVGRDAFRTATGVHAAAVIKAHKKGDSWLADRVYSGVPAAWLARTQEIEIGPMSGNANVIYYLNAHGLPGTAEAVHAIMQAAKHSTKVLTLEEVGEIARSITGSEREPTPTGKAGAKG
jgi:isopropylmalate/homocitrate/citramalate synthase